MQKALVMLANLIQLGTIYHTKTCAWTHQSEGSEHRQSLYIGQPQLHQTQAHNEAIKDIPALLEVVVWVHCNQFGKHFGSEDTSEHLERKNLTFRWIANKKTDLFNPILLMGRLIYKNNLISTNQKAHTYSAVTCILSITHQLFPDIA